MGFSKRELPIGFTRQPNYQQATIVMPPCTDQNLTDSFYKALMGVAYPHSYFGTHCYIDRGLLQTQNSDFKISDHAFNLVVAINIIEVNWNDFSFNIIRVLCNKKNKKYQ